MGQAIIPHHPHPILLARARQATPAIRLADVPQADPQVVLQVTQSIRILVTVFPWSSGSSIKLQQQSTIRSTQR